MIVLDTSVLVPLLDGDEAVRVAVIAWREQGEDIAATSISVAEVLRGAVPGRQTQRARRLLRSVTEVPFGPRAAARFGAFMHALDRAGRPAPIVDGLIAAAVLEAGARLATRDLSGFRHIAGLETIEV